MGFVEPSSDEIVAKINAAAAQISNTRIDTIVTDSELAGHVGKVVDPTSADAVREKHVSNNDEKQNVDHRAAAAPHSGHDTPGARDTAIGNHAALDVGAGVHPNALTVSDANYFRQFWQKQGVVIAGTWAWASFASETDFASLTGETLGMWMNGATHANNDEYKWTNIYLAKGHYEAKIIHLTTSSAGIAELLFNTQSLGTKDMYSAGDVYNVVTILPFIITNSASADLRFKVTGKNGSASQYNIGFSRFELQKVA